jgi:hypothetical protein
VQLPTAAGRLQGGCELHFTDAEGMDAQRLAALSRWAAAGP